MNTSIFYSFFHFIGTLFGMYNTIPLEEVKQDYYTLFQVKTYESKGETHKYVWINDSLPADNRYADFNGKYGMYGSYVFPIFSAEIAKELDENALTESEYAEAFIAKLKNDTGFNTAFLPILSYYLQTKGVRKVKGYTTPPKKRIKTEEILTCCTQFFYAAHIQDNGKIQWKICGGENGMNMAKSADSRNWALEAFCFWAVMEAMKAEDSPVMNYFGEQMTEVSKQTKDIENLDERLKTVRSKMSNALASYPPLKEHLQNCYKSNPKLWGFIWQN